MVLMDTMRGQISMTIPDESLAVIEFSPGANTVFPVSKKEERSRNLAFTIKYNSHLPPPVLSPSKEPLRITGLNVLSIPWLFDSSRFGSFR
jgi:hypothetical protein